MPLPFLNPPYTLGSSQFMYCWSLDWRILSIILIAHEMSAIVEQSEHSLALFFWEDWNENWIFQSHGSCWVFQIYWHIDCSTSTASSFRTWNNSPGIPSLPLALFIVMFPIYINKQIIQTENQQENTGLKWHIKSYGIKWYVHRSCHPNVRVYILFNCTWNIPHLLLLWMCHFKTFHWKKYPWRDCLKWKKASVFFIRFADGSDVGHKNRRYSWIIIF